MCSVVVDSCLHNHVASHHTGGCGVGWGLYWQGFRPHARGVEPYVDTAFRQCRALARAYRAANGVDPPHWSSNESEVQACSAGIRRGTRRR